MTARTWSSHASHARAPKSATHVGRTPLWKPASVIAWAASRQGQGARTNLRTSKAQTPEVDSPARDVDGAQLGDNS